VSALSSKLAIAFPKRPDVVSPGGNAYGEEMTATCLRDMDYYLRLITYGVVAGDVTPIEEIGLVGVKEMYNSLGTPIGAVAEAVALHERRRFWPAVQRRCC
jgi:allophycocyanin alpha subunit